MRNNHTAIDEKTSKIYSAIDKYNLLGYFKRHNHTAIDDIITASDAADSDSDSDLFT